MNVSIKLKQCNDLYLEQKKNILLEQNKETIKVKKSFRKLLEITNIRTI
jgi:hypothetical protein